MTIDYEAAKKEFPVLKAKLTRAKNKGPQAVADVVKEAYAAFDKWGAYPDNWRLFHVALRDARYNAQRAGTPLDLSAFTDDLERLEPDLSALETLIDTHNAYGGKIEELVGGAIGRTKMVAGMDKNQIRKDAKLDALRLVQSDLAATLAHADPKFDKAKFAACCGA